MLTSRALGRVEPSIVKIEGVAPSCSLRIEGSGFVISPQHVLTNAHVVAGVTTGPLVYATNGRVYRGRVVLYDPQRDLAVIDVPGLTAPPLKFAPQAADGTSAIVAGYPLDHPLTVDAARIGRSVTAYGPNIYQTAVVHRQIYPIRAQIEPGNSGGPLLSRERPGLRRRVRRLDVHLRPGYALTAGGGRGRRGSRQQRHRPGVHGGPARAASSRPQAAARRSIAKMTAPSAEIMVKPVCR